jgi:hypothetical protein
MHAGTIGKDGTILLLSEKKSFNQATAKNWAANHQQTTAKQAY